MTVAHRPCERRFTLLAAGGVLTRWSCGTQRVDRDETAVDVEYLADHLSPAHHHHHHHHHLPHPTRRRP